MNAILDTIARRTGSTEASAQWWRLLLIGGGIALGYVMLRGIGRAFWNAFGFALMFFWVWHFAL